MSTKSILRDLDRAIDSLNKSKQLHRDISTKVGQGQGLSVSLNGSMAVNGEKSKPECSLNNDINEISSKVEKLNDMISSMIEDKHSLYQFVIKMIEQTDECEDAPIGYKEAKSSFAR